MIKSSFFWMFIAVLSVTVMSCGPRKGCMDPRSENFDPQAVESDGSCRIKGCTDPKSVNYNPDANVDDASCAYIYGCTDPSSSNYNPEATIDDGSCLYVYGCMDPVSVNYNPAATRDDGSCIYPSDLWLGKYTLTDTVYHSPLGQPSFTTFNTYEVTISKVDKNVIRLDGIDYCSEIAVISPADGYIRACENDNVSWATVSRSNNQFSYYLYRKVNGGYTESRGVGVR